MSKACEVECFFLKPNWEFERTLNSLKYISAREYTNCSSILETDVKRDIGPGGGGGVLRCCLDGGARLKPPNQYPSLRVILAEKGTHH